MRNLLDFLTAADRRRLLLLLVAVITVAILELAGIASILPFMRLVSRPETIAESDWIQRGFAAVGLDTFRSQIVASGLLVLALLTLANVSSAATMWFQHRTAWTTGHGIAVRLASHYVDQPYEFFLTRHSSDLVRRVAWEVNEIVTGVLLSLVDVVAKSTIALVIVALLLFVNAPLALGVAVVLVVAYGMVYRLRRNRLTALGVERAASNQERIKSLNELLSGIKSIKVYGSEAFFLERFRKASGRMARVHPRFQIISQTPRYFIELVALGGILLATIALVASGRDFSHALPVLTLFALAAYRLIPALQLLFASAARLRHTWPVVEQLHADLIRPPAHATSRPTSDRLPFEREIRFEHVTFGFEQADRNVLERVDLTIPRGGCVALVGPTGSGKTTIVDLLVGLLHPTAGKVLVDGSPLTATDLPAWRSAVAYVPQEVFLYDDTVARNIALGLPDEGIDGDRLQTAARLAQAHEFILAELSDGYQTPIGERGVRLSGGQRQRLGIARALYKRPDVLVFDEATSALDGATERALINGLRRDMPGLTIVMIAHRLDTVRACGRIYLVEDGAVTASGTFDELLASSPAFQAMALPAETP